MNVPLKCGAGVKVCLGGQKHMKTYEEVMHCTLAENVQLPVIRERQPKRLGHTMPHDSLMIRVMKVKRKTL